MTKAYEDSNRAPFTELDNLAIENLQTVYSKLYDRFYFMPAVFSCCAGIHVETV